MKGHFEGTGQDRRRWVDDRTPDEVRADDAESTLPRVDEDSGLRRLIVSQITEDARQRAWAGSEEGDIELPDPQVDYQVALLLHPDGSISWDTVHGMSREELAMHQLFSES